MCGISGIVNRKDEPVDRAELQQMTDLIAHRGPDGSGSWYGSNFALGHRRLSIIDLSDNGHQPMPYGDDLVITYNGEVYNYIELRDKLVTLGYVFRSQSDTEIILAAYREWGFECVQQFNGMWSFCIFDIEKNILFCSRDRFGVKPFYYFENEERFAFGSEIKQLLPFCEKRIVNERILLDYLILGYENHTNDTFFVGIQQLEQGSNLIYNLGDHTFQITSYYDLKVREEWRSVNEKEAVDAYRVCLEDAVKLRMRSDVEVGTCLSGGLDSSAVTSLSAQMLKNDVNRKIKAIHARVNKRSIDESSFARNVAEFCDTDLVLVEPEEKDFIASIDEVIRVQEEPFGSPSVFLQYFVMQKAREMNCLVMLDGQGGDETLLGYERYYPAYIRQLHGFKKVKGFLQSAENSKLTRLQLIKYYLYFTNYKFRLKKLKQRNGFLKETILKKFTSTLLKEVSESYLDILKLQKLEIKYTQLPHLLRYEDRNSMAHSVESRLPFLDYRSVETALSLPDEFKISKGWTKYLLRKAIAPFLPEEVVWRRDKLGFNAPEGEWMSRIDDQFTEVIKESVLLNELIEFSKLNLDTLDIRTKWRLFNIAKWEKLYDVQW
ncbi:MAG: asparagine synthase (glutamine-hydrolyzing) [Bacteroidota bacterium]